MSIVSMQFFFFLIVLVMLYFIVPKKWQWVVILIANVLFYIASGIKYLIYIIFVSFIAYWIALGMEYMKKRYGIRYVEAVLRKAVEIIQKCSEETMVIYRVSDNVFLFWMTEPVQLESCIQNMKEQFQQSEEEKNVPLSLAVGAIYNNHIEKETML